MKPPPIPSPPPPPPYRQRGPNTQLPDFLLGLIAGTLMGITIGMFFT